MISKQTLKKQSLQNITQYYNCILEALKCERPSKAYEMTLCLSKSQTINLLEWLTQQKQETRDNNDLELLTQIVLNGLPKHFKN